MLGTALGDDLLVEHGQAGGHSQNIEFAKGRGDDDFLQHNGAMFFGQGKH